MGALLSFLRDAKALLRDLRETVKVTMKLIISVNKIVGDVEEIVEELKISVKFMSKNIESKTMEQEKVIESVKQSLDGMESVKKVLVDNVRNAVAEALVKDITERITKPEEEQEMHCKELEDARVGCGSSELVDHVPYEQALVPTQSTDKKCLATETMEKILEAVGKSPLQDALLSWEPNMMLTSFLSYQDHWLSPLSSRSDTTCQSLKTRGLEFLLQRSLLSKIHSLDGPLVVKLSMWFLGNKCKRLLMSEDARQAITNALQQSQYITEVSQHGKKVAEVFKVELDTVLHSPDKNELDTQHIRVSIEENTSSNDNFCDNKPAVDPDELPDHEKSVCEDKHGQHTDDQVLEHGTVENMESTSYGNKEKATTRGLNEQLQGECVESEIDPENPAVVESSKILSAELLEVGRQYLLGSSQHLDQLQSKLRDHRVTCAELQNHLNNYVGNLSSVL